MKINELRSIIREVIAEEIANESVNKKKIAIAEIKRIISESELTEEDIEEALPRFIQKGITALSSKLTRAIDITDYKFKKKEGIPSSGLVNAIKRVNPNLTDEQAKRIGSIVLDMGEAASIVNGGRNVIANPEIDKNTNPNMIKIVGAAAGVNPNPA
jgi:hypothetical protein